MRWRTQGFLCAAPKTPATASVDLSERSASAKLEASEVMWPLSVRAPVLSAFANSAACGQYVSVSPVARSAKNECKLWSITRAHSNWYGTGKWAGIPSAVGLCSGGIVAI